MRLLLVEDDPWLGDGLAVGFRQEGYTVDWLQEGVAADLALTTETFDVLVLDLGLPRLAGLEVLRRLRARNNPMPVLVLTARDSTGDKVAGLDAGADDYVVKPVDLEELAARVRALLRRSAGRTASVLQQGALILNPATHEVTLAGVPVDVVGRELALLQILLEYSGKVVTRDRLESALYGWQDEPCSNTLEVHIHHLRRKLGTERIKTLRGIGYLMPKHD